VPFYIDYNHIASMMYVDAVIQKSISHSGLVTKKC